MKKNYYRKSLLYFLLVLILILIPLGSIVLIIYANLTVFEYVICGLGIIIFGLPIIEMLRYRIILDNTYIYVGKDKNIILLNIQHETHIELNDIKDVKIERLTTDSNNLLIKGLIWWKSPNTYLTFILKNGKHKRICINFYSKKRVLNLVQEIANRSNFKLSEKLIEDINKLIKF